MEESVCLCVRAFCRFVIFFVYFPYLLFQDDTPNKTRVIFL